MIISDPTITASTSEKKGDAGVAAHDLAERVVPAVVPAGSSDFLGGGFFFSAVPVVMRPLLRLSPVIIRPSISRGVSGGTMPTILPR